RVSLPHLGQAVDFDVSMTLLRSAVFAIFIKSPDRNVPSARAAVLPGICGSNQINAGLSGWIATAETGLVLAKVILHECRSTLRNLTSTATGHRGRPLPAGTRGP